MLDNKRRKIVKTSRNKRLFTVVAGSFMLSGLIFSNASSSASSVQCDPNKYHGWVGKDSCTIYSYKCDDSAEYKAKMKADCEKGSNGPCRSWRGTAFPAC